MHAAIPGRFHTPLDSLAQILLTKSDTYLIPTIDEKEALLCTHIVVLGQVQIIPHHGFTIGVKMPETQTQVNRVSNTFLRSPVSIKGSFPQTGIIPLLETTDFDYLCPNI